MVVGQSFLLEPLYIKDTECSAHTPVVRGKKEERVYGKGVHIEPNIRGRKDTEHFRKILLPKLLPLEEYDKIIVLFSGGKDSLAAYLRLIELGVPKERIELWHHDIDGGHPMRQMDWRCTSAYVKAFAEAEGVNLRVSFRKDGFFGELYREGASKPCFYEEAGQIIPCELTKAQRECEKVRRAFPDNKEMLRSFGYRFKFPAKTASLQTRWCSAYLKIMVADTVISNLEQTAENCKLLIVSGERRGESLGRSMYNEMELHRKHAAAKCHRIVHQWRAVIDYSERDVWEIIRRHGVSPHPCYRIGWNRCSCAMCIFSTPRHFAGIKEVYPEAYSLLKRDEEILGFTLDNHCDLDTFVGCAKSLVFHGDPAAMRSIKTGTFSVDEVYCKEKWLFPAGAFHGVEGGPC